MKVKSKDWKVKKREKVLPLDVGLDGFQMWSQHHDGSSLNLFFLVQLGYKKLIWTKCA
jgi:hypothetical protein